MLTKTCPIMAAMLTLVSRLPRLPAVLRVVVHEHPVRGGEPGRPGLHLRGRGHGHLEPAHLPRVSRIFEAVLIALQEELQVVPVRRRKIKK